MAGFMFLAVVIASLLFIVLAWAFALRENRLAQASIARTERRVLGPTPLNFHEAQIEKRPVARRR